MYNQEYIIEVYSWYNNTMAESYLDSAECLLAKKEFKMRFQPSILSHWPHGPVGLANSYHIAGNFRMVQFSYIISYVPAGKF